MTGITLRQAHATEHALLVHIDDRAATLFEQAGLSFAHLPPEHPFVVAEQVRWHTALTQGGVWLAAIDHEVAGFMVLNALDGAPYLDQLSVLPQFMRRGVGTLLLARAFELSEPKGSLWLTTYGHLPWNRPYYERFGFVPSAAMGGCGPELAAILADQRAALPAPEERIAMRKDWKA